MKRELMRAIVECGVEFVPSEGYRPVVIVDCGAPIVGQWYDDIDEARHAADVVMKRIKEEIAVDGGTVDFVGSSLSQRTH